MSKITIFLDSDGVLTNWNKAACKLFNINPNNIDQYDFDNFIERSELLKKIDQEKHHFWESLEVFSWANDLIKECKKLGNVCILTSPGEWECAPSGKMIHFKKHFPDTPFIITKDKYFCSHSKSLLIDDTEKNVNKFKNHGGHAILFPKQKDIENNKVKMSDFYDLIKKEVDKITK